MFHRKPRPLVVNLESLELENIPQVAGNRPKVGQNHAARRAVSATFFWSYNQVGLYFDLEARNQTCDRFTSVLLTENEGHKELV